MIGSAEHAALNLEVARRSLVLLLRNDGTLPLRAVATGPDGRTLARARPDDRVLGPNADDPQANLGDWAGASGQVDWMPDGHPRETVETVLDGFRSVVPERPGPSPTPEAPRSRPSCPDPEGPLFPTGSPVLPSSVAAAIDRGPAAPRPSPTARAADSPSSSSATRSP